MAATETVSWRERATLALAGASREAAALAVAIPIIFIHLRYQPKFHVPVGSTAIGVELSDFAVLAVVIAAVVSGARLGWSPLRRGLPLWTAAALYFLWIAIEILAHVHTAGYPATTHAVTAAKLGEYALLAPAVVLVVRTRADLRLQLFVLVAWSALATLVGIVQFFGANIFVSGATGGRQLSFLGFHDFATLSAAALLVGVAAMVLPRLALDRRLVWTAAISGGIGVVLSAAIAAVIGIVIACVCLTLLVADARVWNVRRAATAAAIVALTLAGAVGMRSTDLGQYLGFLHSQKREQHVESYAHRTVLAYIGYRIWRDHPIAGVGFEGSSDPARFLPYVPAARRKYPSEPDIAFPSAQRRYGVQNLYVQHLADLGIVGLLLLAAVFTSSLVLAARARRGTGPTVGLLWTLLLAGLWLSQGIVAGLPIDALTWIAFGLAARG